MDKGENGGPGSLPSGQDHNKPLSLPAHSLTIEDALRELETHADDGLTASVAQSRLEEYGPNMLEEGEGVSIVKILVRQVANAMMLVKPPIFFVPSPRPRGPKWNVLYLIQWRMVGARVFLGLNSRHGCQLWNSIVH